MSVPLLRFVSPRISRLLCLCLRMASAMKSTTQVIKAGKSTKGFSASIAKALKATMKKPASSESPLDDNVVDGDVNIALWNSDPTLAASLALVPLNTPDRSASLRAKSGRTVSKMASVAIDRHLPPALVAFKTQGTWARGTTVAIQNYLVSLKKHGFETDDLIAGYKSAKPVQKREVAQMLVLAKDGADLTAVEQTHIKDIVSSGSRRGWVSAYEIWHMERIPLTPDTIHLRMACLAPLDKRPHSNPIRAQLGELEFDFWKKDMTTSQRIHEESLSTSASSKMNTIDDYEAAKKGVRKAAGNSDDQPEAKPARKAMRKCVDPSKMTAQEKKSFIEESTKKAWSRDANFAVAKMNKEEASLAGLLVALTANAEIPARHKEAIDVVLASIAELKSSLMEKQLSANLQPASNFTSKVYTDLIAAFKTLEASWKLAEYAGKKAKHAINLSKA